MDTNGFGLQATSCWRQRNGFAGTIVLVSLASLLLMCLFHSPRAVVGLQLDDENNNGQLISEAHQLYCRQCTSECITESQVQPELTRSRESQRNTNSGSSLRLDCYCRAAYDSRRNSIICKNMSAAEARMPDNSSTTVTRAAARSQAGRRVQINGMN